MISLNIRYFYKDREIRMDKVNMRWGISLVSKFVLCLKVMKRSENENENAGKDNDIILNICLYLHMIVLYKI